MHFQLCYSPAMNRQCSSKYRGVFLFLALSVASTLSFAQDALDIVRSARGQIGITTIYDPAYEVIAFPSGDVPRNRGVCTDVIVRALRQSRQFDLQSEVNSDILENRGAYPKKFGVISTKPDSSIDHRRVPNLMKYFERRGFGIPISSNQKGYSPGDILAWSLGGGPLHIGIVSDKKSLLGVPLIIHNIGKGTQEENVLNDYRLIGHYRLPIKLVPRKAA